MSFYTDKLSKRPNTSQKRTMPKKRKILQESEEEEECERKYEAECVVGGPMYVNGELCLLIKWQGYSEPTWVSKKNFEEDIGGTKALAEMVEAGKNMMWWTAVDECEESDSEDSDMAPKKRKRIHRVKSEDEPK
ncbi:hypothetical protein T484DRAFT_1758606 [Baffinella frigidus]|nr:hypothetical protein T484DRAFT_1758606 [Cryptophyta sp. CCMP2293]